MYPIADLRVEIVYNFDLLDEYRAERLAFFGRHNLELGG